MEIVISESREELAKKAAKKGAELLRAAIKARGEANIIVPAGASQFEMIAALVKEDLNWSVVTAFHLDEYIGLPVTHPASFRKYLKERFADKVMPRVFNYVNGEIDPEGECKRLGKLISKYSIDVAFVGIGENAHLAFNDPPADFDTDEAYIVVNLDEACRKQQLGEGWFPTFDDVPKQAISMSINQIMKTKSIICTVPDLRKANAVKKAVKGPVTNMAPSSIMQKHAATWLYLDKESASLL